MLYSLTFYIHQLAESILLIINSPEVLQLTFRLLPCLCESDNSFLINFQPILFHFSLTFQRRGVVKEADDFFSIDIELRDVALLKIDVSKENKMFSIST